MSLVSPRLALRIASAHTHTRPDPESSPAPADPSSDRVAHLRYDPHVSDAWPPPGPQKREPLLEHVRDLWTLRLIESNCTAAIWRNDFGLELRVEQEAN